MELTLENLKKLKRNKTISIVKNSPIGKEMRILLEEEIEYLTQWQKVDGMQPQVIYMMKERIEFIQLTLNKLK
jgi:hypothetical protein